MPMTVRRESHDSPTEAALLEHAESVCRERGVAFTPIRRDVFQLLSRHDRPVGAYELLDELKALRPRAAPVTVYRALDFLLDAGLAHRINALNAFTACRGSDLSHKGLMLICSKCSHVIELEDRKVERSIQRSAADREFQTRDEPVEVVGTCSDCR
jgi:Fur family transcriptional regulator, zinc uptake regulator